MYFDDAGPLVSVCVPVFNHSSFVAECIESVINQTYQNIELIIIDDGSTDSSYEVVERYRASCTSRFVRFKALSRPNLGVSETLNEGLRWAEGEFFCGLASDDILLPDKTSVLVSFLQSNTNIVAVFGSAILINESSKRIGQRVASAIYNFKDIFLLRAELPAPAALIRRDVLCKAGGFDSDSKIEDWAMWLKISFERDSAIVILPELLACYRIHSGNTWKRLHNMHIEKIKIVDRYSSHKNYAQARAVVDCAYFRDLSVAAKYEAIKVLIGLLRCPWVYKEIRLYQGLFFLFFRW
ncbi:alpha-1,3-rhamnosyltransferase [Pseudomonas brassicacearum]|uniref:Alpha-1,3-rhamnosyltransferase n=1 Tax=Pseudomonas brassicacearum TaxID=930166 RepID=A0AAW8M5A4_9PSED|nr:glycosyltransferase [Pseudomonas brassicacearum]MDR6956352.1 alpha-1,3-rhamnosyltransferase [Pseudomonas brassicacearum]